MERAICGELAMKASRDVAFPSNLWRPMGMRVVDAVPQGSSGIVPVMNIIESASMKAKPLMVLAFWKINRMENQLTRW